VSRRGLLAWCVAAACLLTPVHAAAQRAEAPKRVGILEPSLPAANGHLIDALRQQLRELGWEEGRTLIVELRFADGHLDRLPALAADLARQRVDVFVAAGTPAIRAARQASPATPIVMSAVGDPVAEGLVVSLAKPGGTITGVTVQSPELTAKRIQLLREAAPRLTRLAIVWDSRIVHEQHGLKEAEGVARGAGIALLPFDVQRIEDLEPAFGNMARAGANGVFVFPNSITSTSGKQIAELAARHKLPAVAGVRELAEAGVLLAYGPDRAENYRRAAKFVDRILRGARPGDLPIQQPTEFEFVVNSRTARALGLSMPPSLLLRANHVID
jgi:putative ABC transport system substrate-binding protein